MHAYHLRALVSPPVLMSRASRAGRGTRPALLQGDTHTAQHRGQAEDWYALGVLCSRGWGPCLKYGLAEYGGGCALALGVPHRELHS